MKISPRNSGTGVSRIVYVPRHALYDVFYSFMMVKHRERFGTGAQLFHLLLIVAKINHIQFFSFKIEGNGSIVLYRNIVCHVPKFFPCGVRGAKSVRAPTMVENCN